MKNVNKFLEQLWQGLAYLLVFALPLQTHYLISTRTLAGADWEFGRIMLYAVDILLIITVISGLMLKKINLKTGTKFDYLLIALMVISAISVGVASDKLLAFYSLSRLSLALALVILITKTKLDQKIIIAMIIATASIQAVWGLGQFLTQSTVANKWLGLANHDPRLAGTSVVEAIGPDGYGERWLRAYGGLSHPNVLGGLLAISLILALWLLVNKTTDPKNNISRDWLWLIVIALLSAGLFVTFSRTALLAALLGTIILVVSQLKNWRKLLVALVTIGLTIGICSWHYGYLYQSRLELSSRLETKSTNERMDLMTEAWDLIKAKPLTGVGLANFGMAAWQDDEIKKDVFAYQPVHNLFLLIAAEGGLVLLIIFVALLIVAIKSSWQDQDRAFKLALIAVLVSLMIFDHYLYTQALGVYLLWLVLAIVIKIDKIENN